MALDALALVGFMDEQTAMGYLQHLCAPPIPDYGTLKADWLKAKAKRGEPIPRFGKPKYRDIPPGHDAYLEGVKKNLHYNRCVGRMKASYKMVEIAPLLAFQFHVEIERSARICAKLPKPASTQEMLELCLPHGIKRVTVEPPRKLPNGIIVEAKEANFFQLDSTAGDAPGNLYVAGAILGEAAPLVQVVQCEGRCYLKNGYHRAYGLMMAKEEEMPCLFLEAADPTDIEIPQNGAFKYGLLRGSNPPTCGHFTEERAWRVRIRELIRGWEITWRECSRLV